MEKLRLYNELDTKAKQELSLKWDYLAALTKEYTDLKKRVEKLERINKIL